MNHDIKDLLKEATKDILTEDTLKAIAEAVEKKADEKAQLAVEAALVKQDEDYAEKLGMVLEAVDADHTAKLDKIVIRIDENQSKKFAHALNVLDESHTTKLKQLVSLYENALKSEADVFKKTLVEQLSSYIDLYIDKVIPAEQIKEATENARSRKIVEEVKRLVGLSDQFVNENIKDALLDGKRQIDEKDAIIARLKNDVKLITEKSHTSEKELYLEKALENYPPVKKTYMLRVLSEKSLVSIKENFEYVSDMFDKKESDELENLRESTTPRTAGADVSIPEEIISESKGFSSAEEGNDGADFVSKAYVTEFTKKKY